MSTLQKVIHFTNSLVQSPEFESGNEPWISVTVKVETSADDPQCKVEESPEDIRDDSYDSDDDNDDDKSDQSRTSVFHCTLGYMCTDKSRPRYLHLEAKYLDVASLLSAESCCNAQSSFEAQ